MTLPFLSIGAVGVVAVAAHWAGPEFAQMVQGAVSGDWARARALNERLRESYQFETSEAYPNPVPAKAAMRALGLKVGQCRLPNAASDATIDAAAAEVVARLRGDRG